MVLRPFVPVLFLVALAGVPVAAAQGAGACPAAASADTPDLVVRAGARAAEVRFESRPEGSVRLTGCAPLDSARVPERSNLPRPVQPGRTYRDVSVSVDIRSTLRVECLAAVSALAGLCTAAGGESARSVQGGGPAPAGGSGPATRTNPRREDP